MEFQFVISKVNNNHKKGTNDSVFFFFNKEKRFLDGSHVPLGLLVLIDHLYSLNKKNESENHPNKLIS